MEETVANKPIMERRRHRCRRLQEWNALSYRGVETCHTPLPLWLGNPGRSDGENRRKEANSPSAEHQAPEILLVDDDSVLLESLAELIDLRIPQARVVTCLSGAAALALAASSDFHAIISDVKMPEMDGLTLMTELRRRRPATPIILLTGHGDWQLHTRALELGAFAFLPKPLDRDLFIASLEQALGLRSSREQGTA
jgi:CheY-like chemotaxis protein